MAKLDVVNWTSSVNCILRASSSSLSCSDLQNLAKLISKSESDILNHSDELETFYSSFVALATHYICSSVGSLSKNILADVGDACRVVMLFFLNRLQHQAETCTISKKHMMILMRSLCKGSSNLPKSDVVTFSVLLKSSKVPEGCIIDGTDITEPAAGEAPQQKVVRQLETSVNMYKQLTSVFDDVPSSASASSPSRSKSKSSEMTNVVDASADPAQELRDLFVGKNIVTLQQLNGSDVLLDVCTALAYLKRYRLSYEDAIRGKEYSMPSGMAEAMSIRLSLQSIMNDVSIVWRIFSLPVLEPMLKGRLQKIVSITMSCLQASIAAMLSTSIVTMATGTQMKVASVTRDDEIDGYAAAIVQKTLEIFHCVSNAIQKSSKAGGHVLQNFHMLGSWCLLKGLQSLLNLSPTILFEKSKEISTKTKQPGGTDVGASSKQPKETPAAAAAVQATPRPGSGMKLHTAFGPLCVALSAQAINLLTTLMTDLEVESLSTYKEPEKSEAEADLTLFGEFSAIQRVRRLMRHVNFPNLLTFLVGQSFKKALSFGKQNTNKADSGGSQVEINSDGNSSSSSDSNTFYEEDFSSSENSSNDDDDSEPILGQWFEETLSPNETQTTESQTTTTTTAQETEGDTDGGGAGKKNGHHQSSSDGSGTSYLPDKKEPDGFVNLSADILHFVGQHLLRSPNDEVRNCISGSNLTDQHMSSLASLIRDLDKELPSLQSGSVYETFSTAVAHFVHLLISGETLSNDLQESFLQHLGVNLTSSDHWPLRIRPRTLAVLAEVMLLRQQKEKDAQTTRQKSSASEAADVQSSLTTKNSETTIMNIWNRLISSLVDAIDSFDNNLTDFDDINVEHAQLLVFLFHGLTLMQKKSLWLQLCQAVVKMADRYRNKSSGHCLSEVVPLPLSRLLLIIDYLLHYFYDLPPMLLDQLQYNLFGAFAKKNADSADKDSPTKRFFICREVEDNYVKYSKESTEMMLKPRFYNIGPTEYTYQDTPKVDGLACSFLLSNPDLLNYDAFYDSVVVLLAAGSRLDKTLNDHLNLLEACSVHYHYIIVWRLLGCLPPSLQFLSVLESGKPPTNEFILHSLRWIPRLAHKTFLVWTKDFLVKQGLTTQKAESLLSSVIKYTNTLQFDIDTALSYITQQLSNLKQIDRKEVLAKSDLPSLSDLYILDTILAKIQVSLDDHFTKSSTDSDPPKMGEGGNLLIAPILTLVDAYCTYSRSCLLNQVSSSSSDDSQCSVTPLALNAYNSVIRIGSSHNARLGTLATTIVALLPAPVRNIFEKWNSSSPTEFPAVSSWRNAFANDVIPVESYIESIQNAHLSSLSGQQSFGLNSSLKHVLFVLVKFCVDLTNWYPDSIGCDEINSISSDEITSVFFPLYCDATTDNLSESVAPLLEKFIGSVENDEFVSRTLCFTVDVCHNIILSCSNPDSGLDERIAHECLNFLELNLDKAAGKSAMEKYYARTDELLGILLSAANSHLSLVYGTKVLKFFNRLVQLADKNVNDKSYEVLCISLRKLATLDTAQLQNWLSKMIMIPPVQASDDGKVQENRILLQSLTSYIVKDNSHIGEEVAMAILNALIPMGSQILSPTKEGFGFPDLVVVMVMLAGAGSGSGHAALFKASIGWLELCKTYLAQKNVVEKIKENVTSGKHQMMLESACCLLSYVKDILAGLKQASSRQRPSSPPPIDPDVQNAEADSDGIEDAVPDDEESVGDDSDEESLSNKLCTYTITQKEFMNQHWYHCHTCRMVDGVGVCTVCAKVCHKDHDLSYAKYGSFFCDCGAKEDNVCQALSKRSNETNAAVPSSQQPSSYAAAESSSSEHPRDSTRRPSLSSASSSDRRNKDGGWKDQNTSSSSREISDTLFSQIEKYKDVLTKYLNESNVMTMLIDLLQFLMPSIVENYQEMSPMASRAKVLKAMKDLRELPKTVETSDLLMTATLGSQEGAFENVRINYSGDQGQTIRQLITSHVLRRIGMCCMTSPLGKRQHLAVCNEKGKVTILQLSALLKQAHSSKRKLTLTRLSSAPIPFTVLSIAGSPCNEDFLAVCGLKDCHVLTFASNGTVADHLVLQPALETGNFIIKSVWLPGSQTELAIVTADFVKIYNLAVDAISPQFYFLLPSGKIRDVTFVSADDGRYLLIMGSSGYIYTQMMDETSSARHGTFYITNILDVKHSEVKETGGQVAGGGVSIFYSHSLQLLFFSYAQGKSMAAPISKSLDELTVVFPITLKSANGGKASASQSQPLVQWTELHNHPGVICCMTQTSNNPVVLMIKPDVIMVQEIKVVPSKSKIQDMVVIRHMGSNADKRTTLILLCEDGSLRIYMANVEQTDFWMVPTIQPPTNMPLLKPMKKKRTAQVGRPSGQVTFPVDFFESCQQSNDVEFGGNDVLQMYNTAQLKLRLNTTGMYVTSTKTGGFTIEVTNTSTGTVMVGVRILVGSQSLERAPSYIEIFDRITQVNLTRHRWYDLPFIREELLMADKKFTLTFGPSNDPAGVTMVDSIKVYTKTKEASGWPEENDDCPMTDSTTLPKSPSISNVSGCYASSTATDVESTGTQPLPLTSMDKLIVNALEVLDGCLVTASSLGDKDPVKPTSLDITTKLLTLPVPLAVQQQTKALMSSLFSNRQSYHWHKDQAQLQQVIKCLTDFQEKRELDGEVFQHLVFVIRSVAVSRPLNLVQFAENHIGMFMKLGSLSDTDAGSLEAGPNYLRMDQTERAHLVAQLSDAFWFLHSNQADNLLTSPVCSPGLSHIEVLVAALVDVLHAFTNSGRDVFPLLCKLYTRMLLSEDQQVSFACKQALVRVTRPLQRPRPAFVQTPPRCSTPEAREMTMSSSSMRPSLSSDAPQVQVPSVSDNEEGSSSHFGILEPGESLEPAEMNNEPSSAAAAAAGGQPTSAAAAAAAAAANSLRVLLASGGNLQALLDIPPDADDETMVQLAIALSLQDQPGVAGGVGIGGAGNDGFQGLASQLQGAVDGGGGGGNAQDASAPVSDDEVGSTAATEGSAMYPLPPGTGSGAGSESGGSNVDSVSVSGRSSAYEDVPGETAMPDGRLLDLVDDRVRSASSSSIRDQYSATEHSKMMDLETNNQKLQSLRLRMLERLVNYIPELRAVDGVRSIPFVQLILALTYELDSDGQRDKTALDSLLSALLSELNLGRSDVSDMSTRLDVHEVQLVILRLLSVLMSRTKMTSNKASSEVSTFVSNSTGLVLLHNNGLQFCLNMLQTLLDFSKKAPYSESESAALPGQLLRPRPNGPPPDMSPFFLRQYVKSHANDVFEDYPQLLIEIALRLPYQVKKIVEGIRNVETPAFDGTWYKILSEYMMTQQVPFVKRQVRKLLLYACGSKEKYRQLRDVHFLEKHMSGVKNICEQRGLDITKQDISISLISLSYDMLITVIEHLKSCLEVATARTINWQKYCQKDESVLPFLIMASISLDDGVAPLILQLLQYVLCGAKVTEHGGSSKTASAASAAASTSTSGTSSPAKQKKDKKDEKTAADAESSSKKRGGEDNSDDPSRHDEALCNALVQQVCRTVSRDLLVRFIVCFLLESNLTSVRWQAHALVLHIYRSSPLNQREALLDLMWNVWPDLPNYGCKAAQFVDLLGYFTIKTPQSSDKKTKQYVEKALALMRVENKILANHPNGSIYNILQGLVDFEGYYLERDPCLVCNNPEVPFANIKLSSIKVDSRFTTTTQIVKLAGSQTISKILLKITDIKRPKMVRTLIVHYNNRQVQAVVELKNKIGLWHKAKKVVLSAGQTEVKIDFPLPIVACNLMIEYADFYDNLQASAETLQCPRCSASVPANPGVCGNCGENVFQCHKCRAINYDEKDPFLCNACGYCKYAKFDVTLTTKPCCAVDPIENEEDRKKAITTINTLLERADHQYKQLQLYKSSLEVLLVKVSEHSVERVDESSSTSAAVAASSNAATATSAINKTIQQLAQKYCGDCRTAFEDLGKIIQKVLASRKELVEYDRQQQDAAQMATIPGSTLTTPVITPKASELFAAANQASNVQQFKPKEKRSHCYGCASATVEHCITLLRAMATNPLLKNFLCGQGLIRELVDYNLRRGPSSLRAEVRHLLCLMSNNNPAATDELSELLNKNITMAIQGHLSNPDFAASVRHEMFLLSNLLQLEDHLWEQRIRWVMKLFMQSMHIESPAVADCISLPCLRILQHIIKPALATSKKNKDKPLEALCTVRPLSDLRVNLHAWLSGDTNINFQTWRRSMPSKVSTEAAVVGSDRKKKEEKSREKESEKRSVRVRYLTEKYGGRWRNKVLQGLGSNRGTPLKLLNKTWLRKALFSASSTAIRQTECNIIEALCVVPSRKQDILDMLSSCLDEVGCSGESSVEFLSLYKRLISNGHWKYYLSLKGVLSKIAVLISKEIEELCNLEETSLSSDLSQGYAVKALTDLLATFLEVERIKHHYKSRLVGSVLNGYLSLRKLIIQRSKMIDDTQDKLLELLEEMTTGTESETKEFMSVCVDTVSKYPFNDFISPVFIFERLCSIIFPEANDAVEFFMSLEKEPQQEDFLQGRMLGNPYSCNEPGLGPLMRDVKNKICQDCELVALLEDDTGMELLVCNKIISLDLAVKDVHRKIWLPEHSEGEPMRVVYRMRGLLGDATEDMINTLETGKDEDVDCEVVYKMANVMSQCSGLKIMLQRLAGIRNLVTGKQLMTVLLKLFGYCLKVKINRQELIRLDMNAISIMLGALNLALLAEQESGTSTKGQTLTEQILQIMETILMEASSKPTEMYKEFSKLCGDKDQLMILLDRINSPFVRANVNVLQALMRLIPFLAFGDHEKMLAVVNHFKPYLDFNRYDFDHTQDEQIHLDCFCVIAQGIEKNANGKKLKDLIFEQSIVKDTLDYIEMHAPFIRAYQQSGGESDNWKEFLSKPSLPFVLRMLTGLCSGHESTQDLIGERILPILHNLEQISSDEHVGSLAENLLEALKENVQVAEKIGEVREQTKVEKKRMAMAMREKQLDQLGMMTNEKGQVTVKGLALKHMEDLKDETGLICCICREGYRYQPVKVLGIYTFTKRVNVDDGEGKPRKTPGYSTVSHFNIVHVDCHLAAVRHARGREEWESAALQNGNTKCNGLLPLWGPEVPESVYASCLARHNTYLQDCTGVRDATYSFTIHDVKHLLLKFTFEKSFSEDSGGGGRESNMQLLPYVMHMALYVINTTRSVAREEKNLTNFLKLSTEKWIENCFEIEGPMYFTVMAIHIYDHTNWKLNRLNLLKRLIVLGHGRNVSPDGSTSTLSDKKMKDYSVYKPYVMFFALADSVPNIFFKKCALGGESHWSSAMANYIRNNDQVLQEQAKRALSTFEEELMTCESFLEFFDVAGLLEDIPDPDKFVQDLLSSIH